MAGKQTTVPNIAPIEAIANAGVNFEQHPDLGILVKGNLLDNPAKPIQAPTQASSSEVALQPYDLQVLARYEKQTAALLQAYHGLSINPRDMTSILTFVPRKKQERDLSFDVVAQRVVEREVANRMLAPEGGRVMHDSHWQVGLDGYVSYPGDRVRISVNTDNLGTIGVLPFLISTATPDGRAARAVVAGVMEQYLRETTGAGAAQYKSGALSHLLAQNYDALFPDGVVFKAARNMGIENVPAVRNLLGVMKSALTNGIIDNSIAPEGVAEILHKGHKADPQAAYARMQEAVRTRSSAQRFNSPKEIAEFLQGTDFKGVVNMPRFIGRDNARQALDRLATHLYAGLTYSR